jgi:hypothetical protein
VHRFNSDVKLGITIIVTQFPQLTVTDKNYLSVPRFEALTEVLTKIRVFWDVTGLLALKIKAP